LYKVEAIVELVAEEIPFELGIPTSQIQVLTPKAAGVLGARHLNELLQKRLNPPDPCKGEIKRFGYTFRQGDRVMQLLNDYDKGVYNGETGFVQQVASTSSSSSSSAHKHAQRRISSTGGSSSDTQEVIVNFERQANVVSYEPKELEELAPAYAITIHKSQGSEFPVVVMPIHMEHKFMLQRTLVYTGVTRAKKLVIIVGTKRAMEMAINRTNEGSARLTGLTQQLVAAFDARASLVYPK
jgi:exodeoxyribonuclease V alpha subunit